MAVFGNLHFHSADNFGIEAFMIARILSLILILVMQGCTSQSHDAAATRSPIATCGAGMDSSVKSNLDAGLKLQGGQVTLEFMESVKTQLNPNSASDNKYSDYVRCVLEIDRRNRVSSSDFSSLDWITSSQFQKSFDQRLSDGFYPRAIQGKCDDGGEKFRADWATLPLGASFYAYHGMMRPAYEQREKELALAGYLQVFLNSFRDCSGAERFQAVWLRRG